MYCEDRYVDSICFFRMSEITNSGNSYVSYIPGIIIAFTLWWLILLLNNKIIRFMSNM